MTPLSRRSLFLAVFLLAIWWNVNVLEWFQPITTKALRKSSPAWLVPALPDEALAAFVRAQVVQQATNNNTRTVLSNATNEIYYVNPLEDCSPTAQVRVRINNSNAWMLQAVDGWGHDKSTGGDEFYITWTDDNAEKMAGSEERVPTAVARWQDLEDGTYLLDWFSTPPLSTDLKEDEASPFNLSGFGTLTVHFQYTCRISHAVQPFKDWWRSGGASRISHSIANVPTPSVIRPFERPNSDRRINLASYELVFCHGDSLMLQMVYERPDFFHANMRSRGQLGTELSTAALATQWLEPLETLHGTVLQQEDQRAAAANRNSSVAVVLGSAAWDVLLQLHGPQGADFQDHLQACRDLIQAIRQRYPHTNLYWRLPTALHVHRVPDFCAGDRADCTDVIRYMSTHHIEYLYQQQVAIMKELQVPVLDLYEVSYLSAHELREGDSLHFRPEWNRRNLEWFFLD